MIDNVVDRYSKLVGYLSQKYSTLCNIDKEELAQELWITVCRVLNESDDPENVPYALMTKCCTSRAIDIYRYYKRRYYSNVELDTESEDESLISQLKNYKFSTIQETMLVDDILNLFEYKSKPRVYVAVKLYIHNEIDKDRFETEVGKNVEVVGTTESDILKILGYKSHYPGSWGSIKSDAYNKILDYLLK